MQNRVSEGTRSFGPPLFSGEYTRYCGSLTVAGFIGTVQYCEFSKTYFSSPLRMTASRSLSARIKISAHDLYREIGS